jgi:hypothetical protein
VTNNLSTDITISYFYFVWPVENGPLDHIKLDGKRIWEGLAYTPATISSGWTHESRTIESGDREEIQMHYGSSKVKTGLTLSVTFTNGCTLVTQ